MSYAPDELEGAILEAEEARSSSQYRITSAEARLNHAEDQVLVVSGDPHVDAVAGVAFTAIKEGVGNFVENSKIIMNVMDEVGKIHPFIQVAVSVFKIGLSLELQRRDNDEKIIMLNAEMNAMMGTLAVLKKIASPNDTGSDGLSIEQRMRDLLKDIANSITRCTKLCDSYYKRHITVKVLTSWKWQAKFAEVVDLFAAHKVAIQYNLQLHAGVTITATNTTVTAVDRKINELMRMVFTLMQSTEERELDAFIKKSGGPAMVTKDDQLLSELLDIPKARNESRQKRELTVADTRKEVGKDIEQVLKENEATFNQKFELQRLQIEEVKTVVRRESDRVIEAVLAGPHEKIVDQDMYAIWRDMNWRGSVKAWRMVIALGDHFAEKLRPAPSAQDRAIVAIEKIANSSDAISDASKMNDIASIIQTALPSNSGEDFWALKHISIHHIQPLIEALDGDASSFVTIAEVNAFTAARPADWSLPHWIAYWAVGFEMAVQRYHRQIISSLSRISTTSPKVLPANREIIDNFMQSWSLNQVKVIMASLPGYDEAEDGWDYTLFDRFRGHVLGEEARMKQVLELISYNVDDENTLRLVCGPDRLEKYIMPLLHIILARSLRVIDLALTTVLHHQELQTVLNSLEVVCGAVINRVTNLKVIFKLHSLDLKEQATNFFFGLYNSIFDEDEKTVDKIIVTLPVARANYIDRRQYPGYSHWPDEPPIKLFHGPQMDDTFGLTHPNANDLSTALTGKPPSAASGTWSGYLYSTTSPSVVNGLLPIWDISVDKNGVIFGIGCSWWGDQILQGTIKDDLVVMDRTILPYPRLQDSHNLKIVRYIGTLNDRLDEMTGTYGTAKKDAPGFSEEKPPRNFRLLRRSPAFFQTRPQYDDLLNNRWRALWQIAIKATRQSVVSWSSIRENRDRRKKFISLLTRKEDEEWIPASEDEELVRFWEYKTALPSEIRYWRALTFFLMRRRIRHVQDCSSCGKNVGATRHICLLCSPPGVWFDSVDFCSDCVSKDARVENDDVTHEASHPLMLCRVVLSLESSRAREIAVKDWIAGIDVDAERLPLQCIICRSDVSRPCWYCVDCKDQSDSFVCRSCNTAIEREQPWLLEHVNKSRQKHDWTHCLLHLPRKLNATEASNGVEDKIAQFEAQGAEAEKRVPAIAQASEATLIARLDRLEAQVGEVGRRVQAVAQASEASLIARLDRLEALLDRITEHIPLLLQKGA